MEKRFLLLGDAVTFDPVAGLFQLGAAAIQAGGVVGSAVIASDAQESIAKTNANATLQSQIVAAQNQLALSQVSNQGVQNVTSAVTGTLTSWPVLLFGLALAWILTTGGRDRGP